VRPDAAHRICETVRRRALPDSRQILRRVLSAVTVIS
jgi:hypothetical protein